MSSAPLLAVFPLALAACVCPNPPVTPGARAVKLTVTPSAPRFAPGDPIQLRLDFENVGAAATRLSTMTDGNLRIVTLERDGAPVVPRDAVIGYRIALRTLLNQNLVSLAPGAHVQASWTSVVDPDQGAPALQVVHFDPEGAHAALLSAVGAPGTYTMNVVYRFGDPWTQPDDVFAGETNQATVSFVVGP